MTNMQEWEPGFVEVEDDEVDEDDPENLSAWTNFLSMILDDCVEG